RRTLAHRPRPWPEPRRHPWATESLPITERRPGVNAYRDARAPRRSETHRTSGRDAPMNARHKSGRRGHIGEDLELNGRLFLQVGLDLDDGVVGTWGFGRREPQIDDMVGERPGFRLNWLDLRPARGEPGQGEGC